MRVKVRGIYTTALTKLLSESKFEIVAPSEKINERFDLEDIGDSADTLIYDKDDMNGVTIHGSNSNKVVEILQKNLPDTVFWKMETGSIFCGKIENIDRDNNTIYIDIGKEKAGIISLQNFWGMLKIGEKVLVQIKGESKDGFMLSTKLRLFGDNLILIKSGFTKVSKHVKDKSEKDRLLSLSDDAKSKGWGILWKVLAESKSDKELKKEIDSLIAEEEEIKGNFDQSNDVSLLKEGLCIYFVDFGKKSKERLDEIRRRICPTTAKHHFLKSGGFSLLADVVDSLSSKTDEKKIKKVVDDTIENSIKPGQYFCIIEKRMGGRDTRTKGIVEKIEKGVVEVKRNFGHNFGNDFFEIPINEDDYSISKIKSGERVIQHHFFDKEGKSKGKIFSICTQLELFPEYSRSINLEIDVIEEDGKKRLVGEEKLKSAKGVDNDLKKEASEIASDIKKGELKW